MTLLDSIAQFILGSAADVLPIVIFLFVFQRLVIGERMSNWKQITVGFVFVVVGLGLFLVGLEQTLFPLGRLMAQQLTDPEFLRQVSGGAADLVWQDYYWVGQLLIIAITTIAPQEIVSIAYDSGGVTTSTVTVPLVTALGIGLASSVKGRNPMTDGFGLIALASLMPILFVLIFGIVMQ